MLLDASLIEIFTILCFSSGACCIQHSPTAVVQNSPLSSSVAISCNSLEYKSIDYQI